MIEFMRMPDDAELACRIWQGKAGLPVVLYLHGIEGHSQWFANVAEVLNKHGITIYAPDRRGAGMNKLDRGHLAHYQVLLKDIETWLSYLKKTHPASKIILIGNCWGAKAAAIIAKESYRTDGKNWDLSGLILTSPAIFTKPDFDFKTKCKIAFDLFFAGGKKMWPVPLDLSMFTEDAAYLDFIEHDPLRLQYASSAFFFETLRLGLFAKNAASQIKIPLLLVQAENDRIVNVEQVKNWYEKLSSSNKHMHVFQNAVHCLEFDRNSFNAYASLLAQWTLNMTGRA
jgi:lysophospholipase